MPHYSDGTEAKVGDLVFGKSHASSTTPVAGYVVSVQSSEACNMYVAALRPLPAGVALWGMCLSFGSGAPSLFATATPEIANCNAFTLLHRPEPPAEPSA